MDIIKLQFQTPQELTSFRQSVNGKVIRTDIANLTLTCAFSSTDIELAVKSFGAKVLEEK